MNEVLKEAFEQLVALVAFFAFPVFQYILLRRFSRNEGLPQLWYLPRFGFRLVIRNLPRRKALKDIRYQAVLRSLSPPSSGATVGTINDDQLLVRQDFFLFPGTDQVLICFRIEGSSLDDLSFVLTNKMGDQERRIAIDTFDRLVCDYTATLVNFFNFDIQLAKRVEVTKDSLIGAWKTIRANDVEREFPIDRVRSIG
ncbi:MAG: hypothetical protein WA993_19015 [Candidatus Binatus sp.]|jgi:hypothetical protein